MRKHVTAILALAAGAVFAPILAAPPAAADTIFEVENARAKARAGRYLTDHDAELLDRWGDQTGSRRYYYYYYDRYYHEPPPPPRWYRKHHRRYYRD